MKLTASEVRRGLRALADPMKAEVLRRFFKTGKGEYGEGDKFLGITVPKQREIARKFFNLPLGELAKLLASRVHEERLTPLLILVKKFEEAGTEAERKRIFNFYIKNLKWVNNWDLVDLSAPNIVGKYLLDNDRAILYKLAGSKNRWERRVAIVATLAFIRQGDYGDTLKLAEKLTVDNFDLIHKACGWMLREVGKRDKKILLDFLNKNKKQMPRIMLRYSIERLSNVEREKYLA